MQGTLQTHCKNTICYSPFKPLSKTIQLEEKKIIVAFKFKIQFFVYRSYIEFKTNLKITKLGFHLNSESRPCRDRCFTLDLKVRVVKTQD